MIDFERGTPVLAWPVMLVRAVVGGLLMGLANLVPGISGGTMLLATGIYPAFIRAIAAVTLLRFRLRELMVLAAVVLSAGLAILLLAGTVKDLVVDHRWLMYSLFIGLTLGGVPVLLRMIGRDGGRAVRVGAIAGFVAMAGLASAQAFGGGTAGSDASNVFLLFLAGVAGASAMILPGVSGGYLLLLLGQYIPILNAIETLRQALSDRAVAEILAVGISVLTPVGLGVVTGVCVVSHLLRFMLDRWRSATLGVLLGLLLGAGVGLWPFQRGVPPEVGDLFKGQIMTETTIAELSPDAYPNVYFRPTAGQAAGALGLILVGFMITAGVSRIGRE